MNTADSHSRSSPIPGGLLAMVLLIVAVETFVESHRDDLFVKVQSWIWRQACRSTEKASHQAQVICLGDSLVQLGVAAPVLDSQLDLRTHCLAVSGGQASSSYFLLRRVLSNARTPPKAIVVDFYPRLLEAGPEYNQAQWPAFLSLLECFDLGWTSRDPILFASLLTAKLLPSLDHRTEIRANLRAALAGEDRRVEHNVPLQIRRNLRENKGNLIVPSQVLKAQDLGQEARPWSCHKVNDAYLQRLLSLAATSKIPIFWLLPPVAPEQRAQFDRCGFDARQDQFVRERIAMFPGVIVLDARRTCNTSASYHDPLHLGRAGAIELSQTLAQTLGPLLSPGNPLRDRWMVLDRLGSTPSRVALEDLNQSRAAIDTQRLRR